MLFKCWTEISGKSERLRCPCSSGWQMWNLTWWLELLHWRCPFASPMKNPLAFGQTFEDKLYFVHSKYVFARPYLHSSQCWLNVREHPYHIKQFVPSSPIQDCAAAERTMLQAREWQEAPRFLLKGWWRPKYLGHEHKSCFFLPFLWSILATFAGTQTTAMAYHHWLCSTESSNNRVPGTTWGTQQMKDSDMSMPL